MFVDNRPIRENGIRRSDSDTTDKARENLARLTNGMEQTEQIEDYGSLGDEFTTTREAFTGLYRDLLETGQTPETNGALHPPGHPRVDLMPNGDLFGSYDDLDNYLKSHDLSVARKESKKSGMVGFERHHLIEDHWLQEFGFTRGEAPCVAVYADEHMGLAHGKEGIAAELPRVFKSDKETVRGIVYNIDDLVEGHAKVYRELGRPEWGERLRGYVRDNRERIMEAYQDGTVTWATEEDVARARKYLRSL